MEDRLQKFARLVDAGSFTKAAIRMHISQPALTTAVKKLERELHAELLVRDSHTFRLTPAGQEAYNAAKTMDVEVQNLQVRLRELAHEKTALTIGMIDSIADLLFVHGDNLTALEQGTRLSLTVDNSAQLTKYVEHDELDVAFVAASSKMPRTLTITPLGNEPLVLVTQPAYLADAQADIARGELRHFLSYNQKSQTFQLITEHMTTQGLTLTPTFHSTSPEIMLQLLLSHKATAVLPYLLVKKYIEQGRLMQVMHGKQGVIARSIVSVHRTGRVLPTPATSLRTTATQQLTTMLQTAQAQALQ